MNTRSLSALKRNQVRLGLERLEERETPAGVVTVSLLNNTISFTGDGNAAGNEVRVTTLATNRFRFDGLNGTTFSFAGVGNVGNTVDTGNLPVGVPPFNFPLDANGNPLGNGTTALRVTFLGGPDRFEYDGTSVNPLPNSALIPPVGFGDFTLNMGAGNDTVVLRQFVARNVTVNSTLPTGANTDNDSVTVLAGGVFDFDGNLTPETYLGGLRGSLTVNGQSGNDTITIAATIGANIAASLRDAGDNIAIRGGSRVGGAVTVTETPTTVLGTNALSLTENTRIVKGVTVTNTSNALNATVSDSTIGANLTLNSGSGVAGSTFSLNNLLIGTTLAITGGALQDTVNATNVGVGTTMTMTMGNGGNGIGDNLNTVSVGTNLTINYGTGNDIITLQNSTFGGTTLVNGGEGQDTIALMSAKVGLNLTLSMGNGGNGAGDLLDNVTVAGATAITYGSGNDVIAMQNDTFAGNVTITNGAGVDRFTLQNSTINKSFAYTGGLGGNLGNISPDVVNNVSVAGTFKATYGAGNEELQMTNANVVGATTITGGGGNDVVAISASNFLNLLSVLGGTGTDTINVSNVTVFGTTTLTSSGGDDVVNITQSGRFKGKVTINTGGIGNDFDNITIQADAGNETTFLGGLSIFTGVSPLQPPLDKTVIGTQPGRVLVMNGFSYPDAEAAVDDVTIGPNLTIL